MSSPLQNIFAHLNEEFYLTIDGRTYKHVRGTSPFYLDIPELNSILFVTGKMDARSTFHIYDLSLKSEIMIEGGPIGFGWDIGGITNAESWSVRVLNATSNEVRLISEGGIGKEIISLELKSRTIKISYP